MEIDQLLSSPRSRRWFLATAGTSVAALGALRTVGAEAAAQSINWFAFGTAYSNPYLLEPWMTEKGIEIKQTPWTGSDEMLAKMRGGAAGLFDCASIPQQFVGVMGKEGLIEPIDLAAVPNFAQLMPEFRESPFVKIDGTVWGVPWVWGANAIAFNQAKLPGTDSMAALFDEKNKGRISMRDDPEDSLAVAALYLGIKKPFEMGDAELAEVKKLLVKQKPLIRSYWRSPSDLQTMFANDEISVAWSQLAIIAPLRAGGVDVGWVWPKEGVLGFFNGQCTVKGTQAKAEAEAFANYLVGPDYGVRLADKSGYATTSGLAIAKMSPELLAKVGIDPAKLALLQFKQIIPDRPKWQAIWDEVKSS